MSFTEDRLKGNSRMDSQRKNAKHEADMGLLMLSPTGGRRTIESKHNIYVPVQFCYIARSCRANIRIKGSEWSKAPEWSS